MVLWSLAEGANSLEELEKWCQDMVAGARKNNTMAIEPIQRYEDVRQHFGKVWWCFESKGIKGELERYALFKMTSWSSRVYSAMVTTKSLQQHATWRVQATREHSAITLVSRGYFNGLCSAPSGP